MKEEDDKENYTVLKEQTYWSDSALLRTSGKLFPTFTTI
jgi:hypothetical protein